MKFDGKNIIKDTDITLTNGQFPELVSGNNTISFTGITKVDPVCFKYLTFFSLVHFS